MHKSAQLVLLSAILVVLTFPDWHPEFGVSVDGSCAWLYNYLFTENRAQLSDLIFPHGPLDFLQTPLPLGWNLEIALIVNTLLRFFFVWSGLRLAESIGGSPVLHRLRYWGYALLMAVWLQVNMMDVLLAATVGHFLLLALWTRKQVWLAPAAFLAASGFLVKTIIGMPAVMIYVVTCWVLSGKTRQWKSLAVSLTAIPAIIVLWWVLLFGSLKGLGTMAVATIYLTLGNSAAVCHYPANNWWLLGTFWALLLLWPMLVKETRLQWWALLLPVFAFWKYGISREDIWHIQTTFRFYGWVFGVLLLHIDRIRAMPFAVAGFALIGFQINLRNSEGWSPYDFRSWGGPQFYTWTVHFNEKKAAAAAQCEKNLEGIIMPDSIRNIIGDQTIDVFPWHYAFAAANHLHIQPRHIPQSYAAYHPWLDAQDAAFFNEKTAPDFILFHLKPYNEGGQFTGLDDRFLLNDAPETLLAILDHYRVKARHPKYLLLEKTAKHLVGEKKIFPYSAGWQQQLPAAHGFVRLKANIQKTAKGRLKSLFYKDDPVFLEISTGGILRRIKIVPALARSGIWLAPWLEEPSIATEPYRVPDQIRFVLPDGHTWQLDTASMQIEWIGIDTSSGFIPRNTSMLQKTDIEVVLDEKQPSVAPPDGYSRGWEQTYDITTGKKVAFEITAQIQSPSNNSCCYLVLDVTDANGKQAYYTSTEYCGLGVGENGWPTSLRAVLPDAIAAPYRVKVYVWNTGKKPIIAQNLRVIRTEQE